MKYDEKLLNLFLPFPLKSAESFGPPFLLDLLLNNLKLFLIFTIQNASLLTTKFHYEENPEQPNIFISL